MSRSLRIAHVVRSDSFAGVERYICTVASALAERGHHVFVVGGDPERMRAELPSRVDYAPAATMLSVMRHLGRVRVDVAHAHMTAAELAAMMSLSAHRGRLVATRHFPDQRGGTRLGAWLVRRKLAAQISISEFVAAGVGEPSTVLYNGVEAQQQAPLTSLRVVMLQRLEEEKQPELGLRAWALSGLGIAGWQLEVAGSGAQEAALRRLSAELGVAQSVRFLGQIADTGSLLATTSIVLAPAPAEPFGLSVVEAMARGVPVVAAKGGAHVETLGPEGRFFKPGDSGQAAQELFSLAASMEARLQVGRRLRERQQGLFSIDSHIDGLEQLYARAVYRAT